MIKWSRITYGWYFGRNKWKCCSSRSLFLLIEVRQSVHISKEIASRLVLYPFNKSNKDSSSKFHLKIHVIRYAGYKSTTCIMSYNTVHYTSYFMILRTGYLYPKVIHPWIFKEKRFRSTRAFLHLYAGVSLKIFRQVNDYCPLPRANKSFSLPITHVSRSPCQVDRMIIRLRRV